MAIPKKNEAALEVVSPYPLTAMSVAVGVNLADQRGKANIERDDVAVPRLAIAQSTSPQLKRQESVYNPDLKPGDLFNTITEEIYHGDVTIAIVDVQKRAVVRDKAGKTVERDVDWNDPRCQWTGQKDAEGQLVKPLADHVYDYIAVIVDDGTPGEVVAISLSRTGIKVAKKLNGLIHYRAGATWDGLYTVASVADKAESFNFYNYKFKPAGPATQAVRDFAERVFTSIQATGPSKIDDRTVDGVVEDENVPF